jgi:hypothetical protein
MVYQGGLLTSLIKAQGGLSLVTFGDSSNNLQERMQ